MRDNPQRLVLFILDLHRTSREYATKYVCASKLLLSLALFQ